MTAFYRFPHTPHLAWLGSGPVRDDKILTPQEARAFLTYPVTIEEKNDGATIGFSLSPEASLRIQQRWAIYRLPTKASSQAFKHGLLCLVAISRRSCRSPNTSA